jgi:hypothetical protein
MPKGVEHAASSAAIFARVMVPSSVMPKGVEHIMAKVIWLSRFA